MGAWAYEAGSWGAHAQPVLVQVGLVVWLVTLVGWILRDRREGLAPREVGWLAALVALGLVLRLAAPASPMDIHHRLGPAWDGAGVAAPYGWGMPALARALWTLFGRSDRIVFHANAVIGALTVVPLAGWARHVRLSERGRFWACALLTTMPLHVRLSHTDNQSVPEAFFLLVALWAVSAWAKRGSALLATVAALSTGLASCMRPESLVDGVVVFAWLAACEKRPLRIRDALGMLPYLAVTGLHAVAMTHRLLSTDRAAGWGLPPLHPGHFVLLRPDHTSLVAIGGLVVGAFAARLTKRRRRWLAVIVVTLSLLVWGYSPLSQGLLAARHQLRALPFGALLAGAGIDAILHRLDPWGVSTVSVASIAAAALLAFPLPSALRPTSLNAEYAFYAATLPEVPSCCTIVHWDPHEDRGLHPPHHLSLALGARHRFLDLDAGSQLPRHECAVYYRPASCFTALEGEPVLSSLTPICEQWERHHRLRPWRVARLPRRSSGTDHFGDAAVEVGFFFLDGDGFGESCWSGAAMPGTCARAFTPDQAAALYRAVKAASVDCRLTGQTIDRAHVTLTWIPADGGEVHAELGVEGCIPADRVEAAGGRVVLLRAPDLAQRCPESHAHLKRLIARGGLPVPATLGP